MAKLIFLLAILANIFISYYIYCSDNILSKFHQNGYKVKDFRMQLMTYNKDYLNFCEIKSFKYNRTTMAHNFTVIPKVNVEDKLEGLVQAYKFLSNEYRHFPIRFQLNLQKSFDTDVMGLLTVKKCGNLTNFIFYKDITYHICNFLLDETKLPPLVPNGKYKFEVQVLYLNKETAVMHIFMEIYTPIYPKD